MIQYLFYAAAAVVAAVAANEIVKETTGKPILDHVWEWWASTRDEVLAWLHQRQHLGIARVFAHLFVVADGAASSLRRAYVRMSAHDQAGQSYHVMEREVTVEEAVAQFPEFQAQPTIDVTPLLH
jgi:2-polyprenyl-6-methoxyphenol hydroxylase-like FAD-dependent oxidoreductase